VSSDPSVSVIEQAMIVGLKEVGAVLTKLASMDAEEGTRSYNANYDRIGKWPCGTLSLNTHQHPPS